MSEMISILPANIRSINTVFPKGEKASKTTLSGEPVRLVPVFERTEIESENAFVMLSPSNVKRIAPTKNVMRKMKMKQITSEAVLAGTAFLSNLTWTTAFGWSLFTMFLLRTENKTAILMTFIPPAVEFELPPMNIRIKNKNMTGFGQLLKCEDT